MAAQRRKFQRPLGERRYKKLFLIAAEGMKTEPLYFGIFTDDTSIVRVSCLKGKHDSSLPRATAQIDSNAGFRTTTKASTRGKSVSPKSTMPFAVQRNGIIRLAKTGREILDRRPCIA